MENIDEKPCKVNSNVHIELFGPDGKLKEERFVHNLITTVGLTHIADQIGATPSEAAMSHMAIGTNGAGGVLVGDTTLNTELDRNALTSKVHTGVTVVYIGDWAAGDGTGTITEAGVLNNSSGGTLLCHSAFTAIPKGASDTLKITWTITFA